MADQCLTSSAGGGMKNASPCVYGMTVQKDRRIALRDGIRLQVDLYLPEPLSGTFPALLCYSPYGKEVQSLAIGTTPIKLGQVMYDQTVEACDVEYFVRRGYVVAIADPRGVGKSEGVNHGFLSVQDQKDCCEAITWISKQPWSCGAVGMMGTGWAGRIQPLVAARRPAPLKAIMPIDLIDDLYEENYPGGAVSDYHFMIGGMIPANRTALDATDELGEDGVEEKLAELRKSPEMAENSATWRAIDSRPPCFAMWSVDCLIHDKPSKFWEERSDKGKAGLIDIPVYAVSFYYEFGRNTASVFALYNDPDLKSPKRLLLAEHGLEKTIPLTCVNEEMLRWYDLWLKGMDTGIMDEPPIKLFVMGEGKYRYENEWPSSRVTLRNLYLKGGNRLTYEAPKGNEEADSLYHRPPLKVPQQRLDIPYMEYETEPFEEDTEFSGPLSAQFYISVDQPYAIVEAYVWDVSPDGKRVMLSSGMKKFCPAKLNVPEKCDVELVPVVAVFKKGHRMRLHVKAMDAPVYVFTEKRTLPLLFSAGRAKGALPSTLFTRYHLYHDEGHPSHLTVPAADPCIRTDGGAGYGRGDF